MRLRLTSYDAFKEWAWRPPSLQRYAHVLGMLAAFIYTCFITQVGILANSFPPSRMRSLAFSAFAAGAPVGAGLGLVIGGALTEESKFVVLVQYYVYIN